MAYLEWHFEKITQDCSVKMGCKGHSVEAVKSFFFINIKLMDT